MPGTRPGMTDLARAASFDPVPSVAPAAGERIPVISKPRTIASRRPPRRLRAQRQLRGMEYLHPAVARP